MSAMPVLPWEMRPEWRRRTWYGRAKLLLALPGLAFAWAVVAVFGAAFLAVAVAAWLLGKAVVKLYRAWPSTYKQSGSGA